MRRAHNKKVKFEIEKSRDGNNKQSNRLCLDIDYEFAVLGSMDHRYRRPSKITIRLSERAASTKDRKLIRISIEKPSNGTHMRYHPVKSHLARAILRKSHIDIIVFSSLLIDNASHEVLIPCVLYKSEILFQPLNIYHVLKTCGASPFPNTMSMNAQLAVKEALGNSKIMTMRECLLKIESLPHPLNIVDPIRKLMLWGFLYMVNKIVSDRDTKVVSSYVKNGTENTCSVRTVLSKDTVFGLVNDQMIHAAMGLSTVPNVAHRDTLPHHCHFKSDLSLLLGVGRFLASFIYLNTNVDPYGGLIQFQLPNRPTDPNPYDLYIDKLDKNAVQEPLPLNSSLIPGGRNTMPGEVRVETSVRVLCVSDENAPDKDPEFIMFCDLFGVLSGTFNRIGSTKDMTDLTERKLMCFQRGVLSQSTDCGTNRIEEIIRYYVKRGFQTMDHSTVPCMSIKHTWIPIKVLERHVHLVRQAGVTKPDVTHCFIDSRIAKVTHPEVASGNKESLYGDANMVGGKKYVRIQKTRCDFHGGYSQASNIIHDAYAEQTSESGTKHQVPKSSRLIVPLQQAHTFVEDILTIDSNMNLMTDAQKNRLRATLQWIPVYAAYSLLEHISKLQDRGLTAIVQRESLAMSRLLVQHVERNPLRVCSSNPLWPFSTHCDMQFMIDNVHYDDTSALNCSSSLVGPSPTMIGLVVYALSTYLENEIEFNTVFSDKIDALIADCEKMHAFLEIVPWAKGLVAFIDFIAKMALPDRSIDPIKVMCVILLGSSVDSLLENDEHLYDMSPTLIFDPKSSTYRSEGRIPYEVPPMPTPRPSETQYAAIVRELTEHSTEFARRNLAQPSVPEDTAQKVPTVDVKNMVTDTVVHDLRHPKKRTDTDHKYQSLIDTAIVTGLSTSVDLGKADIFKKKATSRALMAKADRQANKVLKGRR